MIPLENLFIPSSVIYLFVLLLMWIGAVEGARDEISNPWMEDWKSEFEIQNSSRRKLSMVIVFAMVVNITFVLTFITVCILYY